MSSNGLTVPDRGGKRSKPGYRSSAISVKYCNYWRYEHITTRSGGVTDLHRNLHRNSARQNLALILHMNITCDAFTRSFLWAFKRTRFPRKEKIMPQQNQQSLKARKGNKA